MNSINYIKDELYIKTFQKYFFYAFNAIIKLFFNIVYIPTNNYSNIDFNDHPLVEYPLYCYKLKY